MNHKFKTIIKKLQFNGKALSLTFDNVEKTKLINEESYLSVRKARYLMGLKK